ncbi:Cyclic nucleotide-gated cation channel beta-3 [Schistosoma haematobium]|uniref:Cyclic nucleotide-gated cation channel beta-3 n=1 Tax=Schistosoma haematobium TaxID=6185 RepID=A0A922LSU8_SCHHA|nr:Cyclic nucleotide-gated cation channel beta-3 [Schistosoma haematobium]KAH9592677.1 Cyclic nucleotide-gated cation channel beta-3 [Schistosoma haematobium]
MTEEIKDSTDEKEQSQPVISISREAMEKAIAAFPQSKLNRTTTNAPFLGIPQRNARSDSDISVSVVEKLRTLHTKFTERTELIKAKEIEKVEISENESDENETCTDPTKSDENELQLGGEFKTTEIQKEKSIGWWKRYPNRKLIIRQPLCLTCLPSSRKYFISKPNLPCFSIQNPEDNEKQQQEEVKVIKASEQETEQRF